MAAAIDHIPIGTTDHEISLLREPKCPEEWPSGDIPLGKTLITNKWPLHYRGNRDLTAREGACLQGFPYHHQFSGSMTAKRCQIGNAVPPSVSKLIFEEVRKTLRRADGLKVEE